MRNISLLLISIFSINLSAQNYFWGTYNTATADVEGISADATGFGLGYTAGLGNFFSSSAATVGTMDIEGIELDFTTNYIAFGYSINDISEGSLILGFDYSESEVQNLFGGANISDSTTEPFIGYGLMNGEDADYIVRFQDGTLGASVFYNTSENLAFKFGLTTNEDGSGIQIGLAFRF